MGLAASAHRGRGRPRAAMEVSIREAVWSLLASKGYDGLTFEGVAALACCSRGSLYRRHSSKIDLIETVLYETSGPIQPLIPEDVAPRDALLLHARGFRAYMDGFPGKATLSIMEAAARLPELAIIADRHKFEGRKVYYTVFLRIVPDLSEADLSFVFETYVGMFQQHLAILQADLSDRDLERLVDCTIFLLRRCAGSPPL